MKGIRKGAWIKCRDKEEAKQILKQLSDEGYSAVRSSEKYIRVTGEPESEAADKEEKKMAELQLTYRTGYCELRMEDYCERCHTRAADMIGCDMFDNGKTNAYPFPFGDCRYAVSRVGYLGTTTKNYQMEPEEDTYNPHLNCMIVRLRGKIYKCTKVKLDGETIYDSEQETEK